MSQRKLKKVKKLFFVYGTLRKGQSNNPLLRSSKHLGEGVSVQRCPFWDVGFPYLLTLPVADDHPMLPVRGDVYVVEDESVEESLDRLEGVPDHYHRSSLDVTVGSLTYACHVYMFDGRPHGRYGYEHMINDGVYDWVYGKSNR